MTHRVIITQKAKDDLRHYYSVAAQHAPETAARWLNRFEVSLQTLSDNPTRCPLAPEDDLVDQPIYQFFYGKRSSGTECCSPWLANKSLCFTSDAARWTRLLRQTCSSKAAAVST